MIVCDICRKRRPRRQIKVKDTYYDKPRSQGTQYDLCEECFKRYSNPCWISKRTKL